MSSYPILFHPRSTKQNSSSIIQNNKPVRAEDAGMLGIRSFGSSLSLCMGGKSTQTSEINFLWYHLPVHTFAFRIRCWEKGESSAYLRRQCLPSRNDLDHFHPFSQSVPMYPCGVSQGQTLVVAISASMIQTTWEQILSPHSTDRAQGNRPLSLSYPFSSVPTPVISLLPPWAELLSGPRPASPGSALHQTRQTANSMPHSGKYLKPRGCSFPYTSLVLQMWFFSLLHCPLHALRFRLLPAGKHPCNCWKKTLGDATWPLHVWLARVIQVYPHLASAYTHNF